MKKIVLFAMSLMISHNLLAAEPETFWLSDGYHPCQAVGAFIIKNLKTLNGPVVESKVKNGASKLYIKDLAKSVYYTPGNKAGYFQCREVVEAFERKAAEAQAQENPF